MQAAHLCHREKHVSHEFIENVADERVLHRPLKYLSEIEIFVVVDVVAERIALTKCPQMRRDVLPIITGEARQGRLKLRNVQYNGNHGPLFILAFEYHNVRVPSLS